MKIKTGGYQPPNVNVNQTDHNNTQAQARKEYSVT